MIRIMIVDDHVLLTDSLRMVLESYSDFEIVATAHDGQEAFEKSQVLKPDVILMDIKMPLLDGIKAASLIKKEMPKTKIIVLTSMEDGKYFIESLANGIDAYLLKDTPPDRLKSLIECVCWGFCVMSDSVKEFIVEEFAHTQETMTPSSVLDALREEDIKIIRCISEGKNNGEIAEVFGYAMGTVKNKVTHLLEVTGSGNRAQLVMFALRNNLL